MFAAFICREWQWSFIYTTECLAAVFRSVDIPMLLPEFVEIAKRHTYLAVPWLLLTVAGENFTLAGETKLLLFFFGVALKGSLVHILCQTKQWTSSIQPGNTRVDYFFSFNQIICFR